MDGPYEIYPYTLERLKKILVEHSLATEEVVENKLHTIYLRDYCEGIGVRRMLVENHYVDQHYLDDYANTTGYSASDFNSDRFWEWCRIMAHSGHLVFVSEYSAPCDIEVVAEFEKTSSLIQNSTKYSRECLFRVSHRKITYFDQIRG